MGSSVDVVEVKEKEMHEEGGNGDEEKEEEEDEKDDDEEEEEEDNDEEEEKGDGKMNGLEDKFLKIKELEDYLEDDEAREYGYEKKNRRGKIKKVENESDEIEEDGEEDEEGDDDAEVNTNIVSLENLFRWMLW